MNFVGLLGAQHGNVHVFVRDCGFIISVQLYAIDRRYWLVILFGAGSTRLLVCVRDCGCIVSVFQGMDVVVVEVVAQSSEDMISLSVGWIR